MGQLWMVKDLSAVWLSHCVEIAHPGELPGSTMNVVVVKALRFCSYLWLQHPQALPD